MGIFQNDQNRLALTSGPVVAGPVCAFVCVIGRVKRLNKDGGLTQRKALVYTYTSYTELALVQNLQLATPPAAGTGTRISW